VFCITLFLLAGFGHDIVWRSLRCFVVTQYHGQNQQGQTILYKTHRRTSDNTMAKTNKEKQCYIKHIAERQTIPWAKPTRTYNIVFPCWFWPWYCLTFFDVLCIILFVLVGFVHGIVWPPAMCNTITKTNKDKQCYTKHIEERQTIP
jgi:hypothetical protein